MPKGGGTMQLRWAAQLQAPRVQPKPNPQRLLSIITGLLRPRLWALFLVAVSHLSPASPISLSADLPVSHLFTSFLSPVSARLVLSVSSPSLRPLHVASLPLAVLLSLWFPSLLLRPCPCDMNPPQSQDHSRRRSWGSSGSPAYAGECQASALLLNPFVARRSEISRRGCPTRHIISTLSCFLPTPHRVIFSFSDRGVEFSLLTSALACTL